jgi:hypothetical protein
VALVLSSSLLLAACGGEGKKGGDSSAAPAPLTTTAPAATTQASAPSAPATQTTSTGENPATATLSEPDSPAGSTGENGPGGAGDQAGIRVPAVFTFRSSGVSPSTITVPAFLAVELTIVSADGKPHSVTFQGRAISAPAGGRASAHFDGFKAGSYPLGGARATLVVGGEPGP